MHLVHMSTKKRAGTVKPKKSWDCLYAVYNSKPVLNQANRLITFLVYSSYSCNMSTKKQRLFVPGRIFFMEYPCAPW